MILDNADIFSRSTDLNASSISTETIPRLLVDYISKSLDFKRSLIITTRSRQVGQNLIDRESCIEVPPLSIQEAKLLLRLNAEGAFDRSEQAVTRRLLEVLGYIPLAITQAALLLSAVEEPFKAILQLFKRISKT